MSTNITPFSEDCDHVLQQLPNIDMALRYACGRCGGIQDFSADIAGDLKVADHETVLSWIVAELGGTVGEPIQLDPAFLGNEDVDEAHAECPWCRGSGSPLPPVDPARAEPRRWEYPVGGTSEDYTLVRLRSADIAYIDFLDAWIDKCLATGTLPVAAAARYREAIAARCAELGEVPRVREHIVALRLKAGDVLGVISPSESSSLMSSMATYTRSLLDAVGAGGVGVLVFPPGTTFHVLEGAGTQVSDKISEYVDGKIREGVMTQEQFREMLQREFRLQGRW